MPLLVLPMTIEELITSSKNLIWPSDNEYFAFFFNEQNFLIFEFIKFISAS